MNPSYTHLRYSFKEYVWNVFLVIAIAIGIKVSMEETSTTAISILAAMQASVFIVELLSITHSKTRRRWYVSLADRVLLARKLHRDPELKLWVVKGFSADGRVVLLQQYFGDKTVQKQIPVNELFTHYTQLDPTDEEEDSVSRGA